MRTRPQNGDIRLTRRLYPFSKELNGVKKRGIQRVYQRFEQNYSNYDDWESNCWDDVCWEDQVEYVTFPEEDEYKTPKERYRKG